jgi:AraC-like DNA-binding protein
LPDKVVFSSSSLPSHLNEQAKFSLWQDIHMAEIWSVDYSIADDIPFNAEIEARAIGEVNLGRMAGTIRHASRKAQHINEDSRDGYLLLINNGATEMVGSQIGRTYAIASGEAALVSASEAFEMTGDEKNIWGNIVIPQKLLAGAFANIDDLLAMRIGADNEALRLLRNYWAMLEDDGLTFTPDLGAHAASTIVDLVGLATGAKGEATELAGFTGLRAARLAAILEKIRANYTDPRISAQTVANELRLSLRYIHDLLQETGLGFSERILELRLLRTRQMLSDRRNDGLRVGEIALLCGFGDVSYFNRSFRRRFGGTPGSMR